jgi:hypothetical protein
MPEQITKWKAKDGQEFTSEYAARKWELIGDLVNITKANREQITRLIDRRHRTLPIIEELIKLEDEATVQVQEAIHAEG